MLYNKAGTILITCPGGLTTISLPQGVNSFGNAAFSGCLGLISITVAADNLNYSSIGGVLYNKAGTILIACPGGLTSISLPQGVTSIGNQAFANCFRLTSITVAVDNSNYSSIDGVLYNKAGTILIACPGSLTSISLSHGVKSIGEGAFAWCGGLTSISLPEEVTSISNYAFANCHGLTSISIPQGVTSIGDQSFAYCGRLTSITFYSPTTTVSDSEDTIPVTTKIIGYDPSTAKDYATKYSRTFEAIGTITRVSLNKNITTINKGGNETLRATIMPDNTTDKSVTWSVYSQSGSNIATVSDTGLVTAVNAGTAIIRATSNADATKYAECSVTVTAVMNLSATPLVQILINPNDGDSAVYWSKKTRQDFLKR